MLFKRFTFILIISFTFISLSSCKEDKQVIKQTEVSFKKEGELTIFKALDSTKVTLDIEIADTDCDIQTGLMHRDSMKSNQGMLFVFEDETQRYFYMKNTRFSLDIIFINADKKVISFQKQAKPFDESSLPSNAPAKYVLEVNAGLVDALGINIGDNISY
jgi:uncharacterized protein